MRLDGISQTQEGAAILSAWECPGCEVSGRDRGEAICWSCGGRDVVVTARVVVHAASLTEAA